MKILTNFLPDDILQACVREANHLTLDRYDNPFERKWFLPDKLNLPPNLQYAFDDLRLTESCKWVQRILDVPIDYCDYLHYGGLFMYEAGDYLRPHVDAGIHPTTKTHKIATALLYLTPAILETWRGDPATRPDPEVWQPTTYYLNANDCVLFENTDIAWHGVPVVQGTARRIVLTVSYMAPQGFKAINHRNTRERAYFARQVGEGHELDDLRNLRVTDPNSVYRMNNKEK